MANAVPEKILQGMLKMVPLGRLGHPSGKLIYFKKHIDIQRVPSILNSYVFVTLLNYSLLFTLVA